MANGFIQVPADSTGKKLQTFENTVGANTVEAEAVVLVDSTGANACNVNGSGQLPVAVGNTPSVNQGTSPWIVNISDGTNPLTKTFDLDSSGTTHEYNVGVSLRKTASGGSVELGTSSNPIRTDPTGTTTQPISASSLPLPSGAATSAKQPALGTAGTPSADVITVQGKTGMTAVVVDGSGVTQPVSGTFFQATQPVSIAATVVVKADTAANQANLLKVDGSGATQPVSGTVTVQQSTASSLKVDLSGTAANATAIKVDGSAVTQPVSWSGQTVQPVPAATGGMSFFTQSLTSTKAQVKGSAGTVYGITAVNNGSALAYIQVFNKLSANVTVGTTAPDYVVPVPAPSSGTAGAGLREEYALGLAFGTGITVACTTTRTGSTSATCDVNVNYI